ncbi:hypothetical protein AB0442_23070 [Kitasatospora sp. NPDC085895]|uniref:hypothetical protein n=1 Tax=Kitasatospora sp. NPDC085895 TaxID=3155057 RepID=UPI00344DA9E2
MPTPTAMSTARPRKRRTRTTTTSSRPPLALSTLLPQLIDLLPGAESLACPDCGTWCPITGPHSKEPKLVPHHTHPAGTPGARRCIGTNRLVIMDVTIAEQQQRSAEAITDTASRQPTKVLRKVTTPNAPALTQLDPAPPTVETARETYFKHRTRCAACTGRVHCTDGQRLGAIYLSLLRREPQHRRNRELLAELLRETERTVARTALRERADAWNRTRPAVDDADKRRAMPLQGARSPIFPLTMPTGTPTEPLKVSAA